MNDFEKRLSVLLTEQVDHETGPRRAAPPFDPRGGRRRRAPWVTPLLAAACVAAVVAGGFGVTTLVADHKTTPPVGPTHAPSFVHNPTAPPTQAPTTPTSKPTGTPTSTGTSSHPATRGQGSTGPTEHVTMTNLGGAELALPDGWRVTHDNSGIAGEDGDFKAGDYCLAPSDTENDGCVIALYHFTPAASPAAPYPTFDVDSEGLDFGNSGQHLCGVPASNADPQPARVSETEDDATFGGRPADYRYWRWTCHGESHEVAAQYVSAFNPGWALTADLTDMTHLAEYLDALHVTATQSRLPAARSTMRLMDRGIVRSADRGASGVTVAIDRVWRTADGIVNHNPQTYDYLVPTALWNAAKVKVGEQIYIATNGSKVISVLADAS